jgi:hypothetical protein
MDLNQMANNGQTETKAAMRTGRRAVGLPEALEYVRQKVVTDPLPGIDYDNLDARIDPPRANLDAASLGSELDRVGEQVPDHLLQSFRITGHCPCQNVQVSHELNVFRFCRGTHHIQGAIDDPRRLDLLQIQPQLPRYNTGYIEEIIDKLAL